MYSAIVRASARCVGQTWGANEVSFEIQNRYSSPDKQKPIFARGLEAKQVVIASGHAVYTTADPRNR